MCSAVGWMIVLGFRFSFSICHFLPANIHAIILLHSFRHLSHLTAVAVACCCCFVLFQDIFLPFGFALGIKLSDDIFLSSSVGYGRDDGVWDMVYGLNIPVEIGLSRGQ